MVNYIDLIWEVFWVSYHYGGRMSPQKKKKLEKVIVCSLLALSVFSTIKSTFAWHFEPWVYHLPSGDPGIIVSGDDVNKFNWDEVKDTVNNGLNRYEEKEREEWTRNHSDNYYVDKGYSNSGRNYSWESWYWDYSGEGMEKVTISRFDFDTVGGTILTWHKYGEGDWVKERPPGWPYGDDFAMYSSLFDSNIPIRDMKLRSGAYLINKVDLEQEPTQGKPTGIVPLLRSIKDETHGRSGNHSVLGMEGFDLQKAISYAGQFKSLIAKFRDPKSLLSGLSLEINAATTPVNPIIRMYGENNKGYTQEEVEQWADGPVMKDKEKFRDKTNKEALEAYQKSQTEAEKLQEDVKEITKIESSNVNKKSVVESPTSAKEREEQLRRARIALKKQDEEIDGVEIRRQNQKDIVEVDRTIMENRKIEEKNHMPTAKEFAKEMKEKREKYSTSKDLGYRKFGQSKKADFSKILEHTIHPKYKEDDKIGEGKDDTTQSGSSG